eukprot:CAMPEP_0194303676 /NCGR_PEP_ID=MMETSP0171-20130528/1498_1 /TAXON_ID=218684 /ORGANISM="Corethron pennatum, Strain L29A3" /LENGTH=553 /DNA_ID=CAMNT_0039054659 /DNA_START=97 /DNA_END=1758 /DNA_ORIENTATION=-
MFSFFRKEETDQSVGKIAITGLSREQLVENSLNSTAPAQIEYIGDTFGYGVPQAYDAFPGNGVGGYGVDTSYSSIETPHYSHNYPRGPSFGQPLIHPLPLPTLNPHSHPLPHSHPHPPPHPPPADILEHSQFFGGDPSFGKAQLGQPSFVHPSPQSLTDFLRRDSSCQQEPVDLRSVPGDDNNNPQSIQNAYKNQSSRNRNIDDGSQKQRALSRKKKSSKSKAKKYSEDDHENDARAANDYSRNDGYRKQRAPSQKKKSSKSTAKKYFEDGHENDARAADDYYRDDGYRKQRAPSRKKHVYRKSKGDEYSEDYHENDARAADDYYRNDRNHKQSALSRKKDISRKSKGNAYSEDAADYYHRDDDNRKQRLPSRRVTAGYYSQDENNAEAAIHYDYDMDEGFRNQRVTFRRNRCQSVPSSRNRYRRENKYGEVADDYQIHEDYRYQRMPSGRKKYAREFEMDDDYTTITRSPPRRPKFLKWDEERVEPQNPPYNPKYESSIYVLGGRSRSYPRGRSRQRSVSSGFDIGDSITMTIPAHIAGTRNDMSVQIPLPN